MITTPTASAQTAAPSITGIWQAEDGRMKIEMFESGETYAGRLLWGQRAVEADGKTFKGTVKPNAPAVGEGRVGAGMPPPQASQPVPLLQLVARSDPA